MNGRVYDPTLGRFLSADPYVQAPYFSQSYNRYTYTFNNPLIFNDPSGYLADENVNESSKETEDRKEKEKPEKPKPEPKKKTPEKEAKEKAKDEAKKEETGDEEKADDKNECYDSAFCYHIAGDDLSKPDGSKKEEEGEDTSKKKKGNVDGKGGDKQEGGGDDPDTGKYSPVSGTYEVAGGDGAVVDLTVHNIGNSTDLRDEGGGSYTFDSTTGMVSPIANGAAESVCPSCYFIGGIGTRALNKTFRWVTKDGAHKGMGPHLHYGPKYPNSPHPKNHFGPRNPLHGKENFSWRGWLNNGRHWRWK